MAPRRPRKELTSNRVRNSLRANILPLVKNDLKAIGCRATWRVKRQDIEMAQKLIASKRLELDDVLSKVSGVQFFFSSVTTVATNAKRARGSSGDDEATEKDLYPAVAYFVVYRETDLCNPSKIYTLLHNEDTEATVQPITTRVNANVNQVMETAARQLFAVVKDHNSQPVIDMLNTSNEYCLSNCERTTSAEDSEVSASNSRRRYPTSPCRVVVVNCSEFDVPLQQAITKLNGDGMTVEIESRLTAQVDGARLSSTTDELSATLEKIDRLMRLSDHALHRGDVYAKPAEATAAYVKMMDVGSYINKLLVNETLRAKILKHMTTLIRILSHPACEIIKQIQFDFDLIEVSNGYFFQISTRSFVRDAIAPEKLGIVSPRTFIAYDCTKAPEAGYFKEGVMNSFPDEISRANFCNKFYQCLMASKMPHKVRKLVVEGPKDSGKTSWASIFHRVIPEGKIASITPERQFSAAMITEDTQLVIVDEWSDTTLQSDLAKTILQGGWMVTAIKHGLPRTVMNNSPFYITTNKVPNFREDDENVKRRIVVFHTASLPNTTPGVDRWMYTNAMHCLAWLANEITTLHRYINRDELWYEAANDGEERTILNNEGTKHFDAAAIARVTSEELLQTETTDTQPIASRSVIHRSFEMEFTRQRLGRKRLTRPIGSSLSRPPSQSEESHDDLACSSQKRRCTSAIQSESCLSRIEPATSGNIPRQYSRAEETNSEEATDELRSDPESDIENHSSEEKIEQLTSDLESDVNYHSGDVERQQVPCESESNLDNYSPEKQREQLLTYHIKSNVHKHSAEEERVYLPSVLQSKIHNQSPKRQKLCTKRGKKRRTFPLPHFTATPLGSEETRDYGEKARPPQEATDSPNAPAVETGFTAESNEGEATTCGKNASVLIPDQSVWVLNDATYCAKIVELWEWDFYFDNLSRIHGMSFSCRREKAERRRDKEEKSFWTRADPEIDAWMLTVGRTRDVFNIDAFVKRHAKDYESLQRVRRKVEAKVMKDRCPMLQAINKMNGDQRNVPQVDLSSQTYLVTTRH